MRNWVRTCNNLSKIVNIPEERVKLGSFVVSLLQNFLGRENVNLDRTVPHYQDIIQWSKRQLIEFLTDLLLLPIYPQSVIIPANAPKCMPIHKRQIDKCLFLTIQYNWTLLHIYERLHDRQSLKFKLGQNARTKV